MFPSIFLNLLTCRDSFGRNLHFRSKRYAGLSDVCVKRQPVQVASGKSSVVSAMLGDMTKVDGRVSIDGSIAYVAQTAWIVNASLKDNILMNRVFDEDRYRKVISVCALEQVIRNLWCLQPRAIESLLLFLSVLVPQPNHHERLSKKASFAFQKQLPFVAVQHCNVGIIEGSTRSEKSWPMNW